jgi:acyl-CoA reductase-like NAD-dependent aldehyde dehydrogenase
MLELPVLRRGKPYESMEKQDVVHFETGEVLAKVHQANAGILKMDMRNAEQSRNVLRAIPPRDLLAICVKAAELYSNGILTVGSEKQTPEQFCRLQSASTGLPETMCRSNMVKSAYVLKNMEKILDALTRGLSLDIMAKGYGEEGRGVMVSYQATSPVLGCVLPSNSPGVHTLWLPALPMQVGLVLKPGSTEPWTPYRMTAAFVEAGLPKEAISLYPGPHEVGGAITELCERAMIFGSQATIDKYKGNPNVQVHGPGFSKIVLGDDMVDQWEKYIDIMADSIFLNSGRGCINASGVWASRHTHEIAEALAKKLGVVEPWPMTDPNAALAAFTTAGVAEAVNNQIEECLKEPGAIEYTAKFRQGPRLIQKGAYDFLKPTIVHCSSSQHKLANTEYMFPMAAVVECPQKDVIRQMGSTLVCTAITEDPAFIAQLVDARNIDRLNVGNVRTVQLNWLQPHEGNLVEFLYRSRAYQTSPPPPMV